MKRIKTLLLVTLSIFNIYSLKAQELSYSLMDLNSQTVILQKNSQQPVLPASITKLYTAYYVLNKIDSMKTFQTQIAIKGKVNQGLLKGDLILLASGDPYITAQNLISLIQQVKKRGIQKVEGNFFVDPGNFWFTQRLAQIGLEDQADNPSMGIFNVEFNRFTVDKYSHSPIPPMNYLKINHLKKNSDGLKFQLDTTSDHSEIWKKFTKESHSFREEVPTRDALKFGSHYFHYLAELHGLDLPLPKVKKSEYKEIVATHTSLPFYRLVELCLEFSNNLMAEMLLLTTHPKSITEAAKQMFEWYQVKFPQLSWEKINFINGSGLDLENKITAKNLSSLLAKIYNHEFNGRSFWSFLSINGHSGGIRRRLTEPSIAFKVYAKTGSVFFVNNLAGYLIADSGKMYAFSVFTSHPKNRYELNKPNSKKVNKIRQKNKKWYQMSVETIDKMVKSWIKKY